MKAPGIFFRYSCIRLIKNLDSPLLKPSAFSISLGSKPTTTPSGQVIGVGTKEDVTDVEGRDGVKRAGRAAGFGGRADGVAREDDVAAEKTEGKF